jgi:hypothetical protein
MRVDKRRGVLVALAVSVLVVAVAYTVIQQSTASGATFTTLSGEKISRRELRGKLVLVNFWRQAVASACKKCPISSRPTGTTTHGDSR